MKKKIYFITYTKYTEKKGIESQILGISNIKYDADIYKHIGVLDVLRKEENVKEICRKNNVIKYSIKGGYLTIEKHEEELYVNVDYNFSVGDVKLYQ